jgi:hypothetical protein
MCLNATESDFPCSLLAGVKPFWWKQASTPHASSLMMEQFSLIATATFQTIELCDLHQLNVILEQSEPYG